MVSPALAPVLECRGAHGDGGSTKDGEDDHRSHDVLRAIVPDLVRPTAGDRSDSATGVPVSDALDGGGEPG